MLAGCGGSPPPISAPGAIPSKRAEAVIQKQTFHYTGKQQRFKVPPSVTQITVVAIGAAGTGLP
jgi:hypothetical protein